MLPKWTYIYIVAFIMALIIYYMYNSSKNIKVYWFYKPDCKYCIEMSDDWKKLENKLYTSGILCKKMNIEEAKYKHIKDNFNFKKVPHIVKINANGTRDIFDGDRKLDDMLAWIYKNYE
mgnify:FL=1